MISRSSRRRVAGRVALGLALLVLVVGLLVLYLRRDQTHVFFDARAEMDRIEIAESWVTDTASVDRLRFLGPGGEEIASALVRLPADPGAVRRTLVVYAGHETREQVLEVIPERPDLALVAPFYPRIEPEGMIDRLAWPAKLRGAVFTTVAGGMAALDFLDAQNQARGRTAVLAASLGSSFGTIHAALDPRIDDLAVVHGGGDFPVILRHIYERRSKPVMAAVLPWVAEAVIDTFDPVHWIDDISPRTVLLIATRRDRHFPVASAQALYDAAGEPKRIVWTETDHVGASKREIVASIMVEIEAYLDDPVPVLRERDLDAGASSPTSP